MRIISKDDKQASWGVPVNISRDIVSGLADVDRVAYLRYDSEQTGVPYGCAVDVASLLEGLTVMVRDDELPALAVDEGAVSSVEALLTAVYWMYRNVYWHHTNRAFMSAAKLVVRRLLMSQPQSMSFQDYADAVYGKTDVEALHYLHGVYQPVADAMNGRNPLSSLVKLRRIGYRRIFSLGARGQGVLELDEAYKALTQRIGPDKEDDLVSAITSAFPAGASVRDGDILVDIPLKPRQQNYTGSRMNDPDPGEAGVTHGQLWVKGRSLGARSRIEQTASEFIALEQFSDLVSKLRGWEDVHGRKIRVYLSRDIWAGLSRHQAARLPDAVTSAIVDYARSVPPTTQ